MKIFIEEQKFNHPLVIVGLSMAFIVVGMATYKSWPEVSIGSIGEQIGALSGVLILSLVSLLFIFLKLKTRVDETGIYYRYMPIHFNNRFIPWKNITRCYIRKYEAITEYGGWGLKFSFFKKRGKSYTTKGTIGLQLELLNGNKILIGTQKQEELQRVIDTYQYKLGTNEN